MAAFEETQSERAGTDKGTLNAIPSVNANATEMHFLNANTSDSLRCRKLAWESISPAPLNCALKIAFSERRDSRR
jgi:hypothetical protein